VNLRLQDQALKLLGFDVHFGQGDSTDLSNGAALRQEKISAC
jgi:hypothetical protein